MVLNPYVMRLCCVVLRYIGLSCIALYGIVGCCIAQLRLNVYGVALSCECMCVVLYCGVWHCMVLCCVALYCVGLFCNCIVLHGIVNHCIV